MTRPLHFLGCLSELHFGARIGGTCSIFIGPAFLVLLVRRGITAQVPRVIHHQSEVVFVVDARRYVLVVLGELFKVDTTIVLRTLPHVVVRLKCLQEFDQHRLFGALTLDDVWVFVRLVSVFDVVDVQVARIVLVDGLEGLLDQS